MTLRRRTMYGILSLSGGQLVGKAGAFGKHIIIARLVSPADFGIAATFALTVAFLRMISDLAANKLLVQAPDGDDGHFQRHVQLLQAGRGVVNGLLIFALAWPLSRMFGVPGAQWAFHWLALVPVLQGLAHLDMQRWHRELRYGPSAIAAAAPEVAALALAWPLGWWLGDYSVMLWLLLAQAAIRTLLSHLLAERRYGWAWDSVLVRRVLAFGWPLLINSLFLFAIMQGDRLIIGATYSMAELGVYSVAFSLAVMPTLMLAKVNSSLLLPILSETQNDREQFELRYRHSAELLGLAAAAAAIVFLFFGGWLVRTVYGAEYAGAGAFIGWLGMMQAIRLMRSAPSQAAMALGETQNMMIANAVRAAALVFVLACAWAGGALAWIAIAGVLGEAAGMAVAVYRLQHKHGVHAATLRDAAMPLLFVAVTGSVFGMVKIGDGATAVVGIALLSAVGGYSVLRVLSMRGTGSIHASSAAEAAR